MKKRFIGISLVAILAIALTATGVAFAQGWSHGGSGGRGPNGPVDGEEGPLHELMQASMAEALGISVEELEARHEAGETFFDIAIALGFDAEEARELMLAARHSAIDQAVEQGLIDEDSADGMPHGFGRGGRGGYGSECPSDGEGMNYGPRGGKMGRN
ncbi:MAG: hypothetical protein OEV06_01280 [Anaerolineae bacterium]|nr:hypothetical protein [Anaerolineae bacterium]